VFFFENCDKRRAVSASDARTGMRVYQDYIAAISDNKGDGKRRSASSPFFIRRWFCLLCLLGLSVIAQPPASLSRDLTADNRPKHPHVQSTERLSRPEQSLAQRLLMETNRARSKEGLAPLTTSHGLEVIARTHSRNMCEAGELKHESEKYPVGWRTFAERMKRMGYLSGAENLAYRTYSGRPEDWARSVVAGWLDSPQHRKNLLDPTHRYVGIGVFVCRNGVAFATQVFSPGGVSAK